MSAFSATKDSDRKSSSKKSSSKDDTTAASSNPFALPLPDHLSRVLQASRLMLAAPGYSTDTRVALLRVVDGILNTPTEAKFRQLRGDNAFVRKNLTEPVGGLAFLYSIGFIKQKIEEKTYLVWEASVDTPPSSPSAAKEKSKARSSDKEGNTIDELLNLRVAHEYLVHIDSALAHSSSKSSSRSKGGVRIVRVRLPTGAILKGAFVGSDTVDAVHDFVASEGMPKKEFFLFIASSTPNVPLPYGDADATVESLELDGAVLMVGLPGTVKKGKGSAPGTDAAKEAWARAMESKRVKTVERKAQKEERHFALAQFNEDRERRRELEERRKMIAATAESNRIKEQEEQEKEQLKLEEEEGVADGGEEDTALLEE